MCVGGGGTLQTPNLPTASPEVSQTLSTDSRFYHNSSQEELRVHSPGLVLNFLSEGRWLRPKAMGLPPPVSSKFSHSDTGHHFSFVYFLL